MEQFAAVNMRRKKPEFKNCKVVDDSYEEEQLLHSFALRITYIGLDSKTELLEYLWGKDGAMNPEILRDAEFEEVERDTDFKIPDEIMEHIKRRAEEHERRFIAEVEKRREETIEHLMRMHKEKMQDNREEEAKRIEEEIERRKNLKPPELRVKVEPISLLEINAPIEVHRTVLENEFARKEVVWKFDNLTGEHDLRCEKCGKIADEIYLTVDGIGCADCYRECSVCQKPMLNANECTVCHEPLCEEHTHHCSTCNAPLCREHAQKCRFCNNEMCPEHTNRCKICGAPLCEEHTYTCSVCGESIGPMHTRICESCGENVCPEHLHRCEICGKNVCENCAVEIQGRWYCRKHLEKGYGGKLVLPEIRCSECGIALAEEDVNRCEVCNAPLCEEHTHHCSICGMSLCGEHAHRCAICGAELCEVHTFISELSGKEYCPSHSTTCRVCGRAVGEDEQSGQLCDACARMQEISRKDVPREIFAKYPYARRGKEWYVSRGRNVAYITELRGMTLAYRIVNGEIVEHRGAR